MCGARVILMADILSNIHIILPTTMEVHYSIELWTLRTLNILQLTYDWYWITHMSTRIGLCTRKVVLELYDDILSNIHIILQRIDKSPLLYRLMDSKNSKFTSITIYWYWITHISTRIGLCTRKVVLDLY